MDALTVETLAEILQEPKVPLLRQVLRTFGPERTVAVLTDTLQCEAQGGMRTKDGSRRRTPGGVFFQLVKARATPQERQRLFPPAGPQRHQAPARPHAKPHAPTWEEVQAVVPTLPQGEATVKLTLIGRPGQVETHGPAVVFRMQGKPPASLPRGLPPIPSTPALTWTVIVALRQWNRVKDSLTTNEDDQLILEGYPVMEGTQPVLLVQSCASMRQQREKKQAQHPPQAETTR